MKKQEFKRLLLLFLYKAQKGGKGIKGQKEIKFLPCLRGGAAGGGVLPALLVVPSFRNPHGHELRPCCVRPIAAGPNELHFVPFVGE